MALNRWRRRFEGNERVDLPDFRTMLDRVYADFNLILKNYVDNEAVPRVLRRYQQGVHDVNIFKILKDLPRGIQDLNQEWLYINPDVGGTTEDLPVLNNVINYVEVQILFSNDDLQTRAFWDTDIGLTGEEFFDEINVRTRIDEAFQVVQGGFTGGVWIPLFEVTVDGAGLITNVDRADDLFWKNRAFTLPANDSRADVYESALTDLRTYIDFLGAVFSEMKGVGEAIESAPWSNMKLLREYQNIFYSSLGQIGWESPNEDELTWSKDINISIAGRDTEFVLPAGSDTLNEEECIYVDIPEAFTEGTDEQQQLALSAPAVGGDITLDWGGPNITPPIPFDATEADIEDTINQLALFDGGVQVTGTFDSAGPIFIDYKGPDGEKDQPEVAVGVNNLGIVVTPSTTIPGVARIGATLTPVKSLLKDVPISPLDIGHSPRIIVLFYRRGNIIHGAMDIPELVPGEVVVIGSELGANVRTRLGIIDDANFEAYSAGAVGTGIIGAPDSYALAISKAVLAIASGSSNSAQNLNLKLIAGGTFSVATGAGTTLALTNSLAAFVQVPGLANNRNQYDAQTIELEDGEVASIELNRLAGAPDSPAVSITDIAALNPTENTVILARRVGSQIVIGTGTIKLGVGMSKTLDAGVTDQNLILIGGTVTPITEATSAPNYDTRGAPLRTIDNTQSILDAIASVDIELDKFFGQLRFIPHEVDSFRFRMTGADRILKDLSVLSQELNGFFIQFDGAIFNLVTGEIRNQADSATIGNFTPFAIPANEYSWYSVSIIPGPTTVDNRTTIDFTVLSTGNSDPVQDDALKPILTGNKKVGAVQVFNNGGTLEVAQFRQLGQGSGGGSGTGDANSLEIRFNEDARAAGFKQRQFNAFNSSTPEALVDIGVSTGAQNFAENAYELDTGQILRSTQLVDFVEFPANFDVDVARLFVYYKGTPPSALYRLSRMSGVAGSFQLAEAVQVGNTDLFAIEHEFVDEESNALVINQPSNAQPAVDLDDGTLRQVVDQPISFIATEKISHANFFATRIGSFTGRFNLVLVNDDGLGDPDFVDVIAQTGYIDVSDIGLIETAVRIDINQKLVLGQTYHLIKITDGDYKSNYVDGVAEIQLSVGNDAGLPNYRTYDGTTWTVAGGDLTLKHEVFNAALVVQTIAENPLADANATRELNITTQLEIAQPYPLAASGRYTKRQLTVRIIKLGAAVGRAFIKIVPDDVGNDPERAKPFFCKIENIGLLSVGANDLLIEVPEVSVSDGNYNVLIQTDQDYKDNYVAGVDAIQVATDTATPVADLKVYDGVSFTPVAGESFVFLIEGRILGLVIEVEAQGDDALIEGFGVAFVKKNFATRAQFNDNSFLDTAPANTLGEYRVDLSAMAPFSHRTYALADGLTFSLGQKNLSFDGNEAVFPDGLFNTSTETPIEFIDPTPERVSDLNEIVNQILKENFLGRYALPGKGVVVRDNRDGKKVSIFAHKDALGNLTAAVEELE